MIQLKKILKVIVLLAFLTSPFYMPEIFASPQDTVILLQDFDGEPTGSEPEGWTVEDPTTCSLTINETMYYGSSGKSARYVDSRALAGGYSLVGRTFASQESSLIAEFSIRADVPDPHDPAPIMVFIDDGARESTDPIQNGANLYLGHDAEGNDITAFSYFDGNSVHYLCPMSYDTWYRIRMEINIPTNTFDVYIDGLLEAEGASFRAFAPMGEAVTQLSRIKFGESGGKMSGYIDEIWLTSTDPLLNLTPETGFAATTIVGSGFSSYSEVTITWDGTLVPTVPNSLFTDSTGNFTAIISVPTQNTPGTHTVKATDQIGNWATATFTVLDMRAHGVTSGEFQFLLNGLTIAASIVAIGLATFALFRKRT